MAACTTTNSLQFGSISVTTSPLPTPSEAMYAARRRARESTSARVSAPDSSQTATASGASATLAAQLVSHVSSVHQLFDSNSRRTSSVTQVVACWSLARHGSSRRRCPFSRGMGVSGSLSASGVTTTR